MSSGKTGTAQVISLTGARAMAGKMDVRDHGWFVFFAPRDNPQIAGVVFAEHAEHGSSAAPIAKYAMETYFAKLEGRPLPTLTPAPPSAAVPADEPAVTPVVVPRRPGPQRSEALAGCCNTDPAWQWPWHMVNVTTLVVLPSTICHFNFRPAVSADW